MDFDARTILLVEDNEGDAFIFKRFARKAGIPNPVQVVRTGEQAVDYLAGRREYADRNQYPCPFLVLLDLKLPLLGGFDVLQWIRSVPEMNSLSVIVLTSSAEPRDIQRAYELGALSYLVKPPSAETLARTMEELRSGRTQSESRPHIPGSLLPQAARKPQP
jgi:CheY-like chemotaxis protein